MDLILWRHADARSARDGESDAERPLTRKGEHQAERIAQWLVQQLPATSRVLVSPALRTRHTARALPWRPRIVPSLGPEGGVDGLLQAARWPESPVPVVIVAHGTTLGTAAAYLLAGVTQPWVVRKGSLWWLHRRERDGRVEVVLRAVVAPDRL